MEDMMHHVTQNIQHQPYRVVHDLQSIILVTLKLLLVVAVLIYIAIINLLLVYQVELELY